MQFNLRSTVVLSVCGLLLVLAAPSGALARAVTKKVVATEVLTVGVLSGAVPDSHADTDSHLVGLDLMAAQAKENRDAQFTWERDRDGIGVMKQRQPVASLMSFTVNKGSIASAPSIKLSTLGANFTDTLLTIFGTIAVGLIVAAILMAILLPKILKAMGLHPDYDAGQKYDLQGKKALVVTTSHGVLSKPGETTGKPTGVFGSEMTVPYYEFLDAGMQVDVASIKGGEVPIDPNSFRYFIISDQDKRFLKDPAFQDKIKNSPSIDDIDFTDYDLIFFVGGWGPSYDFAQSKRLAERVSEAYYAETPIMGSVCHGALAFVSAKDAAGKPLVAGRKMTGVTQGQLDFFGIKFTPKHPEAELKKAGADYRANHHPVADIFATVTVVDHEQRFVTGQNQNSGHETAQKMMELLSQRSAK
jgi:putative intracellular protease/amidase